MSATASAGAGLEGLLNKSLYQLGESVHVRAMVRDDKGDATRYAQVSLTLSRATGSLPASAPKNPQQFPLNPVESRTGMYDVTIPTPQNGDWTIDLVASKDGKELGRQPLKFTVIPPADEMLKLAANPTLMASIAEQTQGFHYPLAQLPMLIDQLIRTDPAATTAKQQAVPLANTFRAVAALAGHPPQWSGKYDLPMQAALVIALLAAEWILRRRWQLP